MKSHRSFAVGSLILLSATLGLAGGPTYSRFGIGDIIWFGSNRAAGLGGPGYALRGEGFLNLANPAGLSGLKRTRFEGSFFYTSTTSEAGGISSPYSQSGLQSIAFGIPVDTAEGITLLLSTGPYSLVGYSISRSDDQAGVVSTQNFFGRGGLSDVSVALSYAPRRDLFVGMKVSYLYGRVRQFTTINFENTSFTDDEIDRSSYHSGIAFTVGTIWEPGRSLFGLRLPEDFALAASVTLPTMTTVDHAAAFRALDTVLLQSGKATLPLRLGLGASSRLAERYVVSADLAIQDWTGATFLGSAVPNVNNSMRASAGFEALPRVNDPSFFQRIAYRVGAGFQKTYVSVGGTAVNETFLTGGFALPIGPDARLNVALQYGVRGTTDNGLQKDSYVRLNIGLTGSELWFMNFDEE